MIRVHIKRCNIYGLTDEQGHCLDIRDNITELQKQEGHSGPELLTCTMCTSLVQWN